MNYDPLLVSLGYVWRLQGLPPDNNPSFMHGYRLASGLSVDRADANGHRRTTRRDGALARGRSVRLSNVGARQ
jgi:hypothetical protein